LFYKTHTLCNISPGLETGIAQWEAHLIRNLLLVESGPIKDPRSFIEQKTLP